MEKAKRVLIIAGEFPPYKTIGRIRSLKLCKHLPLSGWDPLVLTIGMNQSIRADLTTLKEIPTAVPVYRAAMPEPSRWIGQIAKKLFNRKNSSSHTEREADSSGMPYTQVQAPDWIYNTKARFDRFCYRNLMIPDDWLLWIAPAVRMGKEICRTKKIELILTSSPPFSSILIGRWLKLATGIPWISDYRDLWTGDVLRDWVPAWRRRLEVGLEKWALSKADAVITVSEQKTAFMKQRITKLPDDCFFTVTNGYDLEEYENLAKPSQKSDALRMIYTGRLFKNRRGYELLHAAGNLFRQKPHLKSRLRVEYYGGVTSEIRETMEKLIDQYDLQSNISFLPDVPYEKAKKLQVEADILLLIVDTGETTSGVIPGKLFEYIAAQTPILCIAEQGATSNIIEKAQIGWVIKPGDVKSLQQRLSRLFSSDYATCLVPDENYIAQYDRRRQVAKLGAIMTDVFSRQHKA
jgi:glycosyltransferase involved in cell wall biosynthesis